MPRGLGGLRLGLLDFGTVPAGRPPAEGLFETVELAEEADRLGYSRYWVAEHHEPGLAHAAPELLLPVLAGTTERIRVGTAGILLRMQNPLKVAKNFRVLEGLFGGRIDLGLAAGAAPPETLKALLDGRPMVDDYLERVRAVVRHLRDESGIPVTPLGAGSPEVWVLGAGGAAGARLAGELGVSYGMSLFHKNSRDDAAVIDAYRDAFRPAKDREAPQWNLTLAGFCDEDEDAARRRLAAHANEFIVPRVAGTPAQCLEQLAAFAARYQTDEVVWLELSNDTAVRRRAHELLAAEAGLAAAGSDADPMDDDEEGL